MSIVRIDIPKGTQDGQTSVTPESPTVNTAADTPMSLGKAVALGYGVLGARTGYQTFTQEVRAGGNEELATKLENVGSGLQFATTLVATKGLSLIPDTFNEVASAISRVRGQARENQNIQYERDLRGRRITYNQGRAYE